uniref:Uncharacterized protein n=1 Tax=Cacopsylla melanoneura TaxID=428564 RepID=A0A8D8YE26_9HEMI
MFKDISIMHSNVVFNLTFHFCLFRLDFRIMFPSILLFCILSYVPVSYYPHSYKLLTPQLLFIHQYYPHPHSYSPSDIHSSIVYPHSYPHLTFLHLFSPHSHSSYPV